MPAAQTSLASGQGKIGSVGRAIWSGFPLAWLELFWPTIDAAISFMNRSWWPVTPLAAVLTLSPANARTMSGIASIYSGGHPASGERASSRRRSQARQAGRLRQGRICLPLKDVPMPGIGTILPMSSMVLLAAGSRSIPHDQDPPIPCFEHRCRR